MMLKEWQAADAQATKVEINLQPLNSDFTYKIQPSEDAKMNQNQLKTPFIFAKVVPDILKEHNPKVGEKVWELVSQMVIFGAASQANLDLCESPNKLNSQLKRLNEEFREVE